MGWSAASLARKRIWVMVAVKNKSLLLLILNISLIPKKAITGAVLQLD
jgi:hypothetical protein